MTSFTIQFICLIMFQLYWHVVFFPYTILKYGLGILRTFYIEKVKINQDNEKQEHF